MKRIATLTLCLLARLAEVEAAKPNVLFIIIDDMNDWISLLDPQSPIKTPNLERLAKRSRFGVLIGDCGSSSEIQSFMSSIMMNNTFGLAASTSANLASRQRVSVAIRFILLLRLNMALQALAVFGSLDPF